MRTPIVILTAAVLGVTATPATAQVERYELGQRLKRFEADWETADEAGRQRALVAIRPVTRQYLTFQFGEAARTLDAARFALRAKPPTDAERWFAALAVAPEKRLVDAKTPTLKVEVRAFYTVPGGPPKGATAALHISQGKPVDVPLTKLPATVAVPFIEGGWEGDQLLWFECADNGTSAAARTTQGITRHGLPGHVEGWKRLADANPPAEGFDRLHTGIELATVRDRAAALVGMANGNVPETDIPIAVWEAENAVASLAGPFGVRYFASGGTTTGRLARDQHTLTVPTAGGKLTPCRIYVPPKLDPKTPVPVVVALHGMGGSENLFFEGYGAGCVRKACEKRGWMLVCPRGGNGFLGGPPPVTDILDKLAERYPIDKSRVFLMGHSMGAAQTVELAQAKPGAFAAVAALGGGGRVRKSEAFAGVPTFVGVGSEDFAKSGATGLAKALADGGVKTVTLKEYPGVEHTLIVRVAVDDVFAAFDK